MKIMNVKLWAVAITGAVALLAACNKSDVADAAPFDIKKHCVAGIISPQKGMPYRSVYFIEFLEDNKALIISSGRNMTADYVLSKDSLIITVSDKDNYRIYKYAVNDKHAITSAYYKALALEYNATGNLYAISEANQLAGKVFKGEELKWATASYKKSLYYKFNTDGKTFGTGPDLATIDDKAFPYESLSGMGFKSTLANDRHLGFFTDSLTAFRLGEGGNYYFGTYAKQ